MLLPKLGYRNLWRNRRRTLLTMGAMTLAAALLILSLGIYSGMMWDMLDSATTLYRGQAEITAPGYAKQHAVDLTMPQDPNALGLRGLTVQGWPVFLPQVAASMAMWSAFDWIFSLIFYFAVLLVCVSAMYMALFERMHEFAVIEAIGLKPATFLFSSHDPMVIEQARRVIRIRDGKIVADLRKPSPLAE